MRHSGYERRDYLAAAARTLRSIQFWPRFPAEERIMADAVVYIDALDGLKRVMNNKKLYVKLLNKFKGEAYLDDLKAALGAGDREKAQAAAHTIKGVAANLSLLALSKEALDLESQIKAGAVNTGALESLTARYGETLAEIDKVIAEYAG